MSSYGTGQGNGVFSMAFYCFLSDGMTLPKAIVQARLLVISSNGNTWQEEREEKSALFLDPPLKG
jgi:hypothetical protein